MKINLNVAEDQTSGYWYVRPDKDSATLMRQIAVYIKEPVPEEKMHVTLAYDATNPINPVSVRPNLVFDAKIVGVELLGPDKDILAFILDSDSLQAEHRRIHEDGLAKFDFTPYKPHVTISYDSNETVRSWVGLLLEAYQIENKNHVRFSGETRERIED